MDGYIKKSEIKSIIKDLMEENDTASKKMNSGQCSEYQHTSLVNQYNTRIEVIRKLEKLCD